jgi:hypothetical protein
VSARQLPVASEGDILITCQTFLPTSILDVRTKIAPANSTVKHYFIGICFHSGRRRGFSEGFELEKFVINA